MIAKKAEIKDFKLKVLIWGGAGCGKTRWALNSPKPLVIDTEKSTAIYSNEFEFYRAEIDTANDKANNFITLTKSIIDEINTNVYSNKIETLVIDSISDVFDKVEMMACNNYEKQIKKTVGELDAKDKTKWYAFRKDHFRRTIDSILTVDKHIIMTCRSKLLWGKGKYGLEPQGTQLDGHELLEYLSDIVIKIEDDGKINITKTRLTKENGIVDGLKTFNDLMNLVYNKNTKPTANKIMVDKALSE